MSAFQAMIFAREAHKNQRRKYTNEPYFSHLAEVAGIVSSVLTHNYSELSLETRTPQTQDDMLATAWLHDCVEDCGISLEEIESKFGFNVAVGVSGLSDVENGNRADRKKASRERLSKCSGWIQTIKVADLISNTSSIVMHDPNFSKVYIQEKQLMLDVLTKADSRLLNIAQKQIYSYLRGNT